MPVDVGDLLKFQSRVVYTHIQEDPLGDFDGLTQTVSLEVEAWVIDPVNASAKLSNQFYFTFALPSGTPVRKVLPANADEARKIATRVIADRIQAEED
jgi:acyl-coenzyme A thioesterase 9